MKNLFHYSTIFFFLFFIIIGNEIKAQSRVDSIYAQVAALKENYNESLERLYEEMLEISMDTTNEEYYKVGNFRRIFPIEENMIFLLENIDYEVFSMNDDFSEAHPYWSNFGVFIHQYGEGHPALMKKIMLQLEHQQTDERLFLYALLLKSFFYWNILRSLSPRETASIIRIMANSIVGESQQKQNLFKIAEIIENR